eukprot:905628-Amphidinium_carterae.1
MHQRNFSIEDAVVHHTVLPGSFSESRHSRVDELLLLALWATQAANVTCFRRQTIKVSVEGRRNMSGFSLDAGSFCVFLGVRRMGFPTCLCGANLILKDKEIRKSANLMPRCGGWFEDRSSLRCNFSTSTAGAIGEPPPASYWRELHNLLQQQRNTTKRAPRSSRVHFSSRPPRPRTDKASKRSDLFQ